MHRLRQIVHDVNCHELCVQASEQISACSNNGKDDSSSTALISSPSVSAVDQQKGTLPQKPKYHGMTFADLQEYLQNGATSRGIAPQGTPRGVKSVRPLPTEVEVSHCIGRLRVKWS